MKALRLLFRFLLYVVSAVIIFGCIYGAIQLHDTQPPANRETFKALDFLQPIG